MHPNTLGRSGRVSKRGPTARSTLPWSTQRQRASSAVGVDWARNTAPERCIVRAIWLEPQTAPHADPALHTCHPTSWLKCVPVLDCCDRSSPMSVIPPTCDNRQRAAVRPHHVRGTSRLYRRESRMIVLLACTEFAWSALVSLAPRHATTISPRLCALGLATHHPAPASAPTRDRERRTTQPRGTRWPSPWNAACGRVSAEAPSRSDSRVLTPWA